MALLVPLFQQNNEYSARVVRQMFDVIGTEGHIGVNDLQVTPNSPADFTVNVATGKAFITGDDQQNQGNYLIVNEDTVNLAVGSPDASFDRIDLVCATIRDPNAGGAAGDDALFQVIAGTPAGSPVSPATPVSSIALATLAIGTATASVGSAEITDVRVASEGILGGAGAVGGGSDEVFYENGTAVTADYTLTAGKNAMSAGPITVESGVTVTIPSGLEWTVV